MGSVCNSEKSCVQNCAGAAPKLTKLESMFLTEIFRDLSQRSEAHPAITKHEFLLFVKSRGLWSEHLYHYFSEGSPPTITLARFLQTLGFLSKSTQNEIVEALFVIFAEKNSSSISQKQFVKMIMNLPLDELKQIHSCQKSLETPDHHFVIPTANPRAQRFSSIHQSFQVIPSLERRKSIPQSLENIIDKDKLILAKPTSLSGKIKTWAAQQFEDNSTAGAMSRGQFRVWLNLNRSIIQRFAVYLRRDWWCEFVDPELKLRRLSYSKLSPAVYARVSFNDSKRSRPVEARLVLIDNLLLIFDQRDLELPVRVAILNEIAFNYREMARAVEFSHPCGRYANFSVEFCRDGDFEKCKAICDGLEHSNVSEVYELGRQIGKGHFSTVYKARQRRDPSLVFAVKEIERDKLSEDELKIMDSEVEIEKVLEHPNIIKYYETFGTGKKIYRVLEYAKGVDLFEFVTCSKGNRLSEKLSLAILERLLDAVEHIHTAGVVHRDLKPENIVVDVSPGGQVLNSLKLVDFGFSCFVEGIDKERLCGTPLYMAPEAASGNYDQRIDIYSLGIIFYFMLTGHLPVQSEDVNFVIGWIQSNDIPVYSNPLLKDVSEPSKDLLCALTRRDPADRVSVQAALLSPVFLARRQAQATPPRAAKLI